MTVIHAGALLDRAPGRKYVAALGFAEIAPPEPLPRIATVRRWRDELPEGFVTSFVVPKAATRSQKGALRFDDAMAAALEWSKEAAEVLNARFVVVRTPADLTTGQRDRDLLAAWLERFGAPTANVVWSPTGLWEHELAVPFARKLGVLLAIDPLETEPPKNEQLVYARLRAIGMRSRFSETLLLEVLDALQSSGAEEAFVAIESPRSYKEASRLVELARADA